ncbi:HET-domain-containing protein [Cucurbitaria berberidis CBS 394.84]|uniref:HET-domain-containing protein n=1 Tax=Cucurbitaria berberidis CBS 394.84 TaxID=1168544 RepID=A0A9P4GPX1_9PLEO|nr:HET-domain-containing protein [Cucurbitaria berberidis CBS 394.84]KAF1850518.1 HET-domain-containing protein [Cucurbitaria berberidis CBS 394.84]
MFCRSCTASIQAAFDSLNRARSGNQDCQSETIFHESQPSDLYGEGCWICQQMRTLSLEHEIDYQISNSTEHRSRLTVGSEFRNNVQKVRKSRVELYMFSQENYLILTMMVTEDPQLELHGPLLLDFNLSQASNYAAVSGTALKPYFTSRTTSAMANSRLWGQWIHTCSESHRRCRDLDQRLRPFLPDRLIEIFTQDNGASFTWKLVFRADFGNVRYLTLSHCWGSSTHTSLTSRNISAYSKLSTYSRLPKSFQHAFHITFSLGFQFIWIDSLCIVQDDLKDWKSQASMMGSVYKHASCNIAATWAADGNDGCFAKRESRILPLDLGYGQSTEYQVDMPNLYYDDLMAAPLNTRGWVTQERFLARKQLSFAKSQIYWECRELVASEQYPAGIPQSLMDSSGPNQAAPLTGKPTLDVTTDLERRVAWAALVDFYSNCHFSRVSDKMIALAGLAEEMRNITADIYLAGLWKRDLQSQLCWSTDFDMRRRENRSTVPTYLAPTWSWANVDGPVISDHRYSHTNTQYASLAEVLDASVSSEHISGLHSFVSSRLVLRGIAGWARVMRTDIYSDDFYDDEWIIQSTGFDDSSEALLTAGIHVGIHWDKNMSGSEIDPGRWPVFLEERNSNFLFMFVYINIESSDIVGLLLRRLPETADEVTYVRMGIFSDWLDGSLSSSLLSRLGFPSGESIVEDIDLDNASLAGLVHTINVI